MYEHTAIQEWIEAAETNYRERDYQGGRLAAEIALAMATVNQANAMVEIQWIQEGRRRQEEQW